MLTAYETYIQKHKDLTKRNALSLSSDSLAPEEFILRLYSNQPKEIKFNSFLLTKLSEKYGHHASRYLKECFDLYLPLSSFILDFSYTISDIDMHNLSKDIMNFALELSKDGGLSESLYDYEIACNKYHNALFILDELQRELYHTLRFSNEDTNSSHEEEDKNRVNQNQ